VPRLWQRQRRLGRAELAWSEGASAAQPQARRAAALFGARVLGVTRIPRVREIGIPEGAWPCQGIPEDLWR
jgi:hypothetical protein